MHVQDVSRKDAVTMRFSRVTLFACVCVLVFSALAPLDTASLASVERGAKKIVSLTNDRAEVREESTIRVKTAQGAGAQTKKRPNLFVRIITAPFRGLAKIFSGGKGDKTARVKAKEDKTKAQAASRASDAPGKQTNTQRVEPSRAESQAQRPTENAPRPTGTTQSAPPAVVVATPSQVATQPRAKEVADDSADYEPRRFTPYIEGVPGDPLSQGRALLANGYTNEAIAELSVAAVTGPDLVEANNLLGLAYDRRGQHKQAQEYYERARGVAPQNADVLNNLGHSLYLDDRYKDALSLLKTAARLAPTDTRIANNLALVYGRLAKYDDAFKQFKRAGGEYYARTSTAALLAKAGRDRDAIKHYEAARKLNPPSADVLRQLITLYNRTGQREKAEAAERILDKTPGKASTIS
ncbi:MAG: tetratricopeptide repeat protein [Acidobacteria bacterium]|nr:tetratricopeptide repeat protein [Acidobacteriota bacterium]